MTEKQFQIFCKIIYCETLVVLVLQIIAGLMMLLMYFYDLPGHKEVVMFLGLSIFISLFLISAKKKLFKRKEVGLGMWGNSGIKHSLGVNMFWWFLYFYFEIFGVACAIWFYLKAVWL